MRLHSFPHAPSDKRATGSNPLLLSIRLSADTLFRLSTQPFDDLFDHIRIILKIRFHVLHGYMILQKPVFHCFLIFRICRKWLSYTKKSVSFRRRLIHQYQNIPFCLHNYGIKSVVRRPVINETLSPASNTRLQNL